MDDPAVLGIFICHDPADYGVDAGTREEDLSRFEHVAVLGLFHLHAGDAVEPLGERCREPRGHMLGHHDAGRQACRECCKEGIEHRGSPG